MENLGADFFPYLQITILSDKHVYPTISVIKHISFSFCFPPIFYEEACCHHTIYECIRYIGGYSNVRPQRHSSKMVQIYVLPTSQDIKKMQAIALIVELYIERRGEGERERVV